MRMSLNRKLSMVAILSMILIALIGSNAFAFPEFKLTASDAVGWDHFGSSVSINGASVVVGVMGDDDAGDHSESAYVFTHVGVPYIDKLNTRKCKPGEKIRIAGYGFGEIQVDSAVHIGKRTYDSSSARIKLWSDTKIRIKIPNYKCEWFKDQDYRRRKVWVTVDGADSNKKKLKVMKPASCP